MAQHAKARWLALSDEFKDARNERIASALRGRPKCASTRNKISAAKRGLPRRWVNTTSEKYAERRRVEVASGIGVPPRGNAGNGEFRHDADGKARIRLGVQIARQRIEAERGSYLTSDGKAKAKAKRDEYYSASVREEHGRKIREGMRANAAKRGPVLKQRWFHDPTDPRNRSKLILARPIASNRMGAG